MDSHSMGLPDRRDTEPQTAVGRFMAQRGMLQTKRFKYFGGTHCQYGTTLAIQSLVLSTTLGEGEHPSFGVKFEHEDRDERSEACLVDFDELVELLKAIKHLFEAAKDLKGQQCDYTEVVYSTRDSLRVGFFQSSPDAQQVFFDVAPGGSTMFIGFEQLRTIFNAIKAAREHLIEAGAGSQDLSASSAPPR